MIFLVPMSLDEDGGSHIFGPRGIIVSIQPVAQMGVFLACINILSFQDMQMLASISNFPPLLVLPQTSRSSSYHSISTKPLAQDEKVHDGSPSRPGVRRLRPVRVISRVTHDDVLVTLVEFYLLCPVSCG